MIFTKTLLSVLVPLAALASPVTKRGNIPCCDKDCDNGNGIVEPTIQELLPACIYNYDVSNGKISCSDSGLVKKHWNNNGHDITTLVTFSYPPEMEGKTCQFGFKLAAGDTCTGSKKFDLFTSLEPAPGCTDGWPPGNRRNIHLGRMNAAAGDEGTWEATYWTYLTDPTPCPHGEEEGMELVGVYDVDNIEWNNQDTSGPRIYYWE